jgi:ATP-dependent DNA helicase RecG
VVLGTFRHELPRLPELVVREAIANAVAHRSYENNRTSIRISIFPDQVVILSPGGFPEPVTEQNIRDTTAARNPTIIKILRSLRLAEDAGLGVDRMQDAMKAEMLDPPRFHETDVAVEVTLRLTGTVAPRERAWVREQERRGEILPGDRIVLVHAARGEVLTNARVRELLSVDSVDARQILQRLRSAGFLRQTGERGGSQYLLEEGLMPPAGLRLTRSELKQMVVQAASDGPITNAVVRDMTGLGREEVKQLLRELIEEEALVLTGAGRGAHYVLPGASPQLALGVDPPS